MSFLRWHVTELYSLVREDCRQDWAIWAYTSESMPNPIHQDGSPFTHRLGCGTINIAAFCPRYSWIGWRYSLAFRSKPFNKSARVVEDSPRFRMLTCRNYTLWWECRCLCRALQKVLFSERDKESLFSRVREDNLAIQSLYSGILCFRSSRPQHTN